VSWLFCFYCQYLFLYLGLWGLGMVLTRYAVWV
jgi:hypothetical protein